MEVERDIFYRVGALHSRRKIHREMRTDSTTSADVVGCDISSPCFFVTLFALADATCAEDNIVDIIYYIVQ